MKRKTNWLALVVSVVVSMFIGFLWYGALFQTQWMAGNGITMEGDVYFKNGAEMPMSSTPMIVNTVIMVLYALLMNWLLGLTNAQNWVDGAKVGAGIGLFSLGGILTGNMFANNDFVLTGVDGSYALVLFTIIGAIIGGWQKR